MRDGQLTRGQVQAWALNRYYYQARIPARTPTSSRACRPRRCAGNGGGASIDHDGESEDTGGIARWLKLTDGLGLDRELCGLDRGAAAGDPLCRRCLRQFRPRPLAARSSRLVPDRDVLAGRSSPSGSRACSRNYDFVSRDTLAYFTPRLTQAPTDVAFALAYVKRARRHAGEAAAGSRHPAVQVRRAVGAARRALFRLCRARVWSRPAPLCRNDRDGRGRRERAGCSRRRRRPALRAACQVPFRRGAQAWIVLAPERLLLPDEPAVDILQLIDGRRDVDDVIDRACRALRRAARGDRRRCRRDAAGPRRQESACADDRHRAAARAPGGTDASLPAALSLLLESAGARRRQPRARHRDWKRVFSEAAALGVLQVHFSGGEPLGRRDLVELVAPRRRGRALRQPDHLGHSASTPIG